MLALVDCNAFFASCEQLFRPDLRGKPVIVLSNNDGCIVARSKEAKALGIPDLAPYFKVKDQIEAAGVTVFSSNYELYGDLSSRVMQTLEHFSPNLEIYSIDEAFVSLEGMQQPLHQYGQEIRNTVLQHVGLAVGVGIGATKTQAKLASFIAKKSPRCNFVCAIENTQDWQNVFQKIPVREIWGIGSRLSRRLGDEQIYSVWDLMQQDPERMKRRYSVNVARTITELNGTPCFGLDESPAPKKQIFSTRSFGEKVTDCLALEQAISQYATRACQKLRKEELQVKSILVFASSSRFHEPRYSQSIVVPLTMPTNDSRTIIQASRQVIRHRIFKPGVPFARAGVGLIDLTTETPEQLDAFTPRQSEKSKALMNAIDQVNIEHGGLFFASQGIDPYWRMQRRLKSPAYTTQWRDLPKVKV